MRPHHGPKAVVPSKGVCQVPTGCVAGFNPSIQTLEAALPADIWMPDFLSAYVKFFYNKYVFLSHRGKHTFLKICLNRTVSKAHDVCLALGQALL